MHFIQICSFSLTLPQFQSILYRYFNCQSYPKAFQKKLCFFPASLANTNSNVTFWYRHQNSIHLLLPQLCLPSRANQNQNLLYINTASASCHQTDFPPMVRLSEHILHSTSGNFILQIAQPTPRLQNKESHFRGACGKLCFSFPALDMKNVVATRNLTPMG